MQETTIFKPLYALTHAPINAYFSKNSDDFVVREIPLYAFSGQGEHLIVEICKKDMTTQEALHALSEISGVKMRDFGYAGLKDKQGMTTQFISMPRKFEAMLANFSHEKMKILSLAAHDNKLRIGHLKGNSFFIRLKKVMPSEAAKLEQAVRNVGEAGYLRIDLAAGTSTLERSDDLDGTWSALATTFPKNVTVIKDLPEKSLERKFLEAILAYERGHRMEIAAQTKKTLMTDDLKRLEEHEREDLTADESAATTNAKDLGNDAKADREGGRCRPPGRSDVPRPSPPERAPARARPSSAGPGGASSARRARRGSGTGAGGRGPR